MTPLDSVLTSIETLMNVAIKEFPAGVTFSKTSTSYGASWSVYIHHVSEPCCVTGMGRDLPKAFKAAVAQYYLNHGPAPEEAPEEE